MSRAGPQASVTVRRLGALDDVGRRRSKSASLGARHAGCSSGSIERLEFNDSAMHRRLASSPTGQSKPNPIREHRRSRVRRVPGQRRRCSKRMRRTPWIQPRGIMRNLTYVDLGTLLGPAPVARDVDAVSRALTFWEHFHWCPIAIHGMERCHLAQTRHSNFAPTRAAQTATHYVALLKLRPAWIALDVLLC